MNRQLLYTISAILILQLASCGLKYVPSQTAEELETNRRASLESQLKADFSSIGKTYTHLTYGKMVIQKPASYHRLDSLFQIKYQLEQNYRSTKEIDPLIESQQMVILSDTSEVFYVETNWFELSSDTLLEYLIGKFYLNNKNVIRQTEILEQFSTDKSNQEWARIFMKETGFISNDVYLTTDEMNFFNVMKAQEFALTGEQKELFLDNVFHVMKVANSIKSLDPKLLCVKLAEIDFQTSFPNFNVSDVTFSYKKELDTNLQDFVYIVEAVSKSNPTERYLQEYSTLFVPLY